MCLTNAIVVSTAFIFLVRYGEKSPHYEKRKKPHIKSVSSSYIYHTFDNSVVASAVGQMVGRVVEDVVDVVEDVEGGSTHAQNISSRVVPRVLSAVVFTAVYPPPS
jgi:hypothetical protein